MGDVIIAGVHAADETLEELIAADVIVACVDQTGLIRDVKGELALLLNDHHIAGLLVHSLADQIHQLLGFAGALQTHDNIHHRISTS